MKKTLLTCGMIVMLIGCSGGGGGKSTAGPGTSGKGGDVSEAKSEPKAKPKPWDPALGTATVRGVVKFSGKPPRQRPIDMAAKPECMKIHSEPVLDESIIVNPDGTLKNAFVWVKRGLQGWEFPVPTEPAVLDQKGCMFHPHVMGVQVRQKINIRNDDTFGHNVHSLPAVNTSFNFTQGTQGQEDPVEFTRREVLVKFKCDIHGWMSSYLGVVDHPFFAVTSEDGKFELKNLPPGDFTIEAKHEELPAKSVTVTLADQESKDIEFSLEVK